MEPFSLGKGNYEKGIIAVDVQLQLLDDPSRLAKQIQKIYQSSFELNSKQKNTIKTKKSIRFISSGNSFFTVLVVLIHQANWKQEFRVHLKVLK